MCAVRCGLLLIRNMNLTTKNEKNTPLESTATKHAQERELNQKSTCSESLTDGVDSR